MVTPAQAAISRALYSLKRQYPSRVVIHRRSSRDLNLETGEKTIETDSWAVQRAIMLPSTVHRQFVYDLTFIATNKNFTYGGHFDTNERRTIVDAKDMPAGWEPRKDDYVVFDGTRYEVASFDQFEYKAAWVLTIRALIGQETSLVEPQEVITTLHLSQEVGVTLN